MGPNRERRDEPGVYLRESYWEHAANIQETWIINNSLIRHLVMREAAETQPDSKMGYKNENTRC